MTCELGRGSPTHLCRVKRRRTTGDSGRTTAIRTTTSRVGTWCICWADAGLMSHCPLSFQNLDTKRRKACLFGDEPKKVAESRSGPGPGTRRGGTAAGREGNGGGRQGGREGGREGERERERERFSTKRSSFSVAALALGGIASGGGCTRIARGPKVCYRCIYSDQARESHIQQQTRTRGFVRHGNRSLTYHVCMYVLRVCGRFAVRSASWNEEIAPTFWPMTKRQASFYLRVSPRGKKLGRGSAFDVGERTIIAGALRCLLQ